MGATATPDRVVGSAPRSDCTGRSSAASHRPDPLAWSFSFQSAYRHNLRGRMINDASKLVVEGSDLDDEGDQHVSLGAWAGEEVTHTGFTSRHRFRRSEVKSSSLRNSTAARRRASTARWRCVSNPTRRERASSILTTFNLCPPRMVGGCGRCRRQPNTAVSSHRVANGGRELVSSHAVCGRVGVTAPSCLIRVSSLCFAPCPVTMSRLFRTSLRTDWFGRFTPVDTACETTNCFRWV